VADEQTLETKTIEGDEIVLGKESTYAKNSAVKSENRKILTPNEIAAEL
jgi:hypothetical protein